MIGQYDLFGKCEELPKPKPKIDKVKRNWENRFQRWSDKMAMEDGILEGKCGYGSMCDYCSDNDKGSPCVRALNEMCRDRNIKIDYENVSCSDAWNGVFS